MPPNIAISSSDSRLLPNAIDEIARLEPEALYAEYPTSATSYNEGFTPVTFAQFANAINGVAWLLVNELGQGKNHETVAYIGVSDLRYMIMAMGAVKAGYKVSRYGIECSCEMRLITIDIVDFSAQ